MKTPILSFRTHSFKCINLLLTALLICNLALSQSDLSSVDGWLKLSPDSLSSTQPGLIQYDIFDHDFEGYANNQWHSLTKSTPLLGPFGPQKKPVSEDFSLPFSDVQASTPGWSMAIHDSFLVAGDPYSNNFQGAAYVYLKTDTGWVEIQKLEASDGSDGDFFGCYVDIYGRFIVIGARLDDGPQSRQGSAYVFEFNGTNWIEQQKLTAYNGGENYEYGCSVSIYDSTIAVGSRYAFNRGRVYIYKLLNNTWGFQKLLKASDAVAGDEFGYSVNIHGAYIAVGAPRFFAGDQSGKAYMFFFSNNDWAEQQIFYRQERYGLSFGSAVATDGANVVICAVSQPIYTGGGSAHVYRRQDTTWHLTANLVPYYVPYNIPVSFESPPGYIVNRFGQSVAIQGNLIIVGAPGDQLAPDFSTSHVYKYNSNEWIKIRELKPQINAFRKGFGQSIAYDGKTLAIGSRHFKKIYFY